MFEPITESIKQGYAVWRKNLVLGVPQLIGAVLSVIILFASLIGAGMIAGLTSSSATDIASNINPGLIMAIAAPLLIGFVLVLLVMSFFTAGSINMSIKAVETGKTSLNDLFISGVGNTFRIFVSTLLFFIVVIAGLAVFIPSGLAFTSNMNGAGLSLLFLGCSAYVLFLAIATFLYTMVPVAIVAGNNGLTEGITRGVNFALRNKLKIVLLWGFYFFASEIFGFAFGIVTGPLYWFSLVSPVIYAIGLLIAIVAYTIVIMMTLVPLFYVWMTRIYLAESTGLKKITSKPFERKVISGQSSTPRELYI